MSEKVNGREPKAPTKKYSNDAGWDLYVPHSISIQPGQSVMVDTGIRWFFPQGKWGQLREKSGLAHRYGLMILGGVVDEGYQG